MFSVIIPNYNHGRFLQKRIESVLNQTFTDFEIILLDDCSTDNSLEILNSYNDLRITKRIYNEKNSGNLFSQWKKGIKLAKYEYIWIAESDDFCTKDLLKSAYEILKKNENISLYYCDSNLIGENEEPFVNNIQKYTKDLDENLWNSDHCMNGKEYVRKYLSKKNFILNASSVIFKKKNGLEAINFIQNYRTSGDWVFYGNILLNGDVYFHANKQNFFRHLKQSTRNYDSLLKRQIRIIEKTQANFFFISNYDHSEYEINNIYQNLIDEWINYHLSSEIFRKSFFQISKLNYLEISPVKLFQIALISKIKNRWQNLK